MKPGESVVDSLESASEGLFDLESKKPEALVIHCADPRFRSAFQEFINSELGVNHHTLLSLAGGVGPFVLESKSVQTAQLMDQLRLLTGNNGIKKLIVMNHTDCKWYSEQMPDHDSNSVIEKQLADLQQFSQVLQTEIADMTVLGYLAVLTQDKVHFRKVPLARALP